MTSREYAHGERREGFVYFDENDRESRLALIKQAAKDMKCRSDDLQLSEHTITDGEQRWIGIRVDQVRFAAPEAGGGKEGER